MTTHNNLHWSNIDKKTRSMIMIGLALGMLVAILDGTIVGVALPTIATELNGFGLYSWAITAFMLCETAMIPIAGKLSDQYGRKPIFLIGMTVFLAGSILCGIAGTMDQFVIFRAIQGLGGGMLVPVATAAVADLYAPTERGKIQGLLGALFAIAMCLGPIVGGVIVENVPWHWIFTINIPIGAIALALTLKKFPVQEHSKAKVDYIGMGLLTGFLFTLLLFFTWAGVDFPWASVESGVMIVVAAVLLLLFIEAEKRAEEPVLRLSMFRNRIFTCCVLTMMIFGMGLMGLMAFFPMFVQDALGKGIIESGLFLLPFVFGVMATAMSSGMLVKKTGYRPWLIAGPIVMAIGMILLSTISVDTAESIILSYLFITGLGMGCVMAVVMIAAQNGASRDEMGMVTSSVNLFRAIGSTVAVGIFTSIINGRLNSDLSSIPGLPAYDLKIMNYLPGIPEPIHSMIIDAFGNSVTFAFFIGALITLVALGATYFIRGKPEDIVEED